MRGFMQKMCQAGGGWEDKLSFSFVGGGTLDTSPSTRAIDIQEICPLRSNFLTGRPGDDPCIGA